MGNSQDTTPWWNGHHGCDDGGHTGSEPDGDYTDYIEISIIPNDHTTDENWNQYGIVPPDLVKKIEDYCVEHGKTSEKCRHFMAKEIVGYMKKQSDAFVIDKDLDFDLIIGCCGCGGTARAGGPGGRRVLLLIRWQRRKRWQKGQGWQRLQVEEKFEQVHCLRKPVAASRASRSQPSPRSDSH